MQIASLNTHRFNLNQPTPPQSISFKPLLPNGTDTIQFRGRSQKNPIEIKRNELASLLAVPPNEVINTLNQEFWPQHPYFSDFYSEPQRIEFFHEYAIERLQGLSILSLLHSQSLPDLLKELKKAYKHQDDQYLSKVLQAELKEVTKTWQDPTLTQFRNSQATCHHPNPYIRYVDLYQQYTGALLDNGSKAALLAAYKNMPTETEKREQQENRAIQEINSLLPKEFIKVSREAILESLAENKRINLNEYLICGESVPECLNKIMDNLDSLINMFSNEKYQYQTLPQTEKEPFQHWLLEKLKKASMPTHLKSVQEIYSVLLELQFELCQDLQVSESDIARSRQEKLNAFLGEKANDPEYLDRIAQQVNKLYNSPKNKKNDWVIAAKLNGRSKRSSQGVVAGALTHIQYELSKKYKYFNQNGYDAAEAQQVLTHVLYLYPKLKKAGSTWGDILVPLLKELGGLS